MKINQSILWLNQVSIDDISLVGGKNASLGEMITNFDNIRIPNGFVITTKGYRDFIEYNKLSNIESDSVKKSNDGSHIRHAIINGKFPPELEKQIVTNYQILSELYNTSQVDVAVRSSSTMEDLAYASFAGQQDTFLQIKGNLQVLDSVKKCFASLYNDRAISYRRSICSSENVDMSVCIQKMVRSDLASSGVTFTLDTESGFPNVCVTNSIWGLGEFIVQGIITPDEYIVHKPTFKQGYNSIVEKKLGKKEYKLVYENEQLEKVQVPLQDQLRYSLTDQQILQLCEWALQIEEHYSNKFGKWTPMDIEWAVDGLDGELYIVQARQETIHKNNQTISAYRIPDAHLYDPLMHGIAVGERVSTGVARIMTSLNDINLANFETGDILVTDITTPDWEPIMKKSAGIITNQGGRTSHCAIVARELGIPGIVGTSAATTTLKDGQFITMSCCQGEIGYIYPGQLNYVKTEIDLFDIKLPKTKIKLNVSNPDSAFKYCMYPNDGVGLARIEFIISDYIGVHPNAILNNTDNDTQTKINTKISGFENARDYYITKLSYGIAKIGAAFYPKQVLVRFSDFKTNEYFGLLGGSHFENLEANPMIGFRGCSRYYSESFSQAFGLECEAIKHVRDNIGLKNVAVMLPFCRTIDEYRQTVDIMAKYGLKKGDLPIFMMAEIPSNFILAEEFAEHVSGFSIGSNDITQLTLGLDRDNHSISYLFNERDPAVKKLIAKICRVANKHGLEIGCCGQGASDYPDFAQFLVEQGISSVSVVPDSLFKTINAIQNVEQRLIGD